MKLIFVFAFLVSCASNKTEHTTYKEVNNIKNSDFKPVKQVRYRKSQDKYDNVKLPETSITNKESIQRVVKYEGDFKLTDDIGQIANLCYQKKFKQAFVEVRKVNRKYINNPILWNQVGTCYLLDNDRRKALLFYNKSLGIKSNYAPALNNLGVMYFREGDHSRALVAFKKAIKSGSFNTVPRMNLAYLFLTYGLYDDAIELVEGLSKVNTKDVDVSNILGTAYLMKNDIKKSVSYFSKIDSDFLEQANYGVNAALASHLGGNTDQAVDIIDDLDEKTIGSWSSYLSDVKRFIGVKK